jgi:methyl-accepting chemotaxis protein
VIHAITKSAAKVRTLVDKVNLGNHEQARGIEHSSKSIAEMDRVTQANAASAGQSESASQEMSAQAESLQNIARELRTLVGGGDDHTHATRPSSKPARIVSALTPSQRKKERSGRFCPRRDRTAHRSKAAMSVPAVQFSIGQRFVNMSM